MLLEISFSSEWGICVSSSITFVDSSSKWKISYSFIFISLNHTNSHFNLFLQISLVKRNDSWEEMDFKSSLVRFTSYSLWTHVWIKNPDRLLDGAHFLAHGQTYSAIFIDMLYPYLDGDAPVDMIALGKFHEIHPIW